MRSLTRIVCGILAMLASLGIALAYTVDSGLIAVWSVGVLAIAVYTLVKE